MAKINRVHMQRTHQMLSVFRLTMAVSDGMTTVRFPMVGDDVQSADLKLSF